MGLEVILMVYRARSVGVTVTLDINALLFIDKYAEKNKLSRSMGLNELLRLARAYLKVLDAQAIAEGDESVETPSILLKREASSAVLAASKLEKKAVAIAEKPKKKKKSSGA